MSLFKGRMDSGGEFTAQDDVRGLRIIAPGALPSYWSVECGDGVDWYFWVNDSDELIMDNSAPTSTYDSVGNIVTGAGNSGANVTLGNLGTVSMTAILTPAATTTTDIGTSSKYFNDCYLGGKLYLSSNVTLDAGASARLDLVGDIQVGVSGTGNDITLFADTAGSYMKWSAAGNTNKGTMLIQDDAMFLWGDSSDITMTWVNGGGFEIEAAADDSIIKFGGTAHIDVVFYNKTSTNDVGWIADSSTMHFAGASILAFGGAAVLTYDAGWSIAYDESETLNVEPYTTGGVFRIGETIVADFHLDGTSYDVIWDASESEYLFNDNAKLVFGGTSDDLIITSNGTLVNMTFGATTNSLVLAAYAAQTVAALHIDGATNDWDGADNVGMLHLSGDTALVDAGASLLYVGQATAKPINSAEGFLARFEDTAPVASTTPAYIVQMHSTNNFGLHIVTGKVSSRNLVMDGIQAQTAEIMYVDGTTGTGWTGAASVGMVGLKADGTLGNAAASLLHINWDGTYAANTIGGCINVDDDATAGGADYSVSVNSLGVNCMHLESQAATMMQLDVENAANATVASVLIDGDSNGWLGATNVGQLHIQNDIAGGHANATMLMIDKSAAIAEINDFRGSCLRIVENMNVTASAPGYAMYISSTNNEALYVDAGYVTIDEYVGAAGFVLAKTARAATADGTGTGAILAGEGFIEVSGTAANNWITLPAPVVGTVVWATWDAQGCEVRTSDPATIALNGGSGAGVESAVAASQTVRFVCATTTAWIATNYHTDGTESKLEAAA